MEKFLRDEITVSESVQSWRERDGVIYFSITSDGITGKQWIERLESKGFRVSDYAKQLLLSSEFIPTNGVTIEIAVLKGVLFSDDDRVIEKIRKKAGKRNLSKPNPEIACLIREKFSDEELKKMGLRWIVVMHEPIKDSDGDSNLLGVNDGRRLDAGYDRPGDGWLRVYGFAFVVSQV